MPYVEPKTERPQVVFEAWESTLDLEGGEAHGLRISMWTRVGGTPACLRRCSVAWQFLTPGRMFPEVRPAFSRGKVLTHGAEPARAGQMKKARATLGTPPSTPGHVHNH